MTLSTLWTLGRGHNMVAKVGSRPNARETASGRNGGRPCSKDWEKSCKIRSWWQHLREDTAFSRWESRESDTSRYGCLETNTTQKRAHALATPPRDPGERTWVLQPSPQPPVGGLGKRTRVLELEVT